VIKRLFASFVLVCSASYASAATVEIDQSVSSLDNLYYADWGHWYTLPEDKALANPDSNPARAVSLSGSGFNFAGFDSLSISASGMVVDHYGVATDANGDPHSPDWSFQGDYFRGQPVYSLIGIWSTSPDDIVPLGDPQASVFFIGTSLQLTIPEATSLYLFLAENDGGFGDNSGSYDVHLSAVSAVPVPAAWTLFLSGVTGLQLVRRRRNA